MDDQTKEQIETYLLFNGWTVERAQYNWWIPPKGSRSARIYSATRILSEAFRFQQIDEGKFDESHRNDFKHTNPKIWNDL